MMSGNKVLRLIALALVCIWLIVWAVNLIIPFDNYLSGGSSLRDIAALVFLGIIFSLVYFFRRRRVREIENLRKKDIKKLIKELALRRGGKLRSSEVAEALDLAIGEAEKILGEMVIEGTMSIKITEGGAVIYEFVESIESNL
jgi:hypothetical protein